MSQLLLGYTGSCYLYYQEFELHVAQTVAQACGYSDKYGIHHAV